MTGSGFKSGEESPINEAQKFDLVMRKILSVSKDELKKREKNWRRRRERARKKRALS
jgi:U3 small nucleolar ribonucleoprotein component